MIAGTRALAPLIAGLALSHLSYPSVAWIQVKYWNFRSDNLHASFQAAVLLIFTVGQVRVCFPQSSPTRSNCSILNTGVDVSGVTLPAFRIGRRTQGSSSKCYFRRKREVPRGALQEGKTHRFLLLLGNTCSSNLPFTQLEDSSSLPSIGFASLESVSPCSTSPSLALTA